MKESYDTPPTYNERYGFTNGAQRDLFVTPVGSSDRVVGAVGTGRLVSTDPSRSGNISAPSIASTESLTPQATTSSRRCAAKRSRRTD
jgi:hypothetical protein